jgi:hypothetical protein
MLIRAILLILATFCAALPARAEPRIALLIANQDYKSGVGKLVNPVNDIRLVGKALQQVGFKVLPPVSNATRADMLDAIDRYVSALKSAGDDAVGFIYYSGHGIAARGTNYLIPVDVEKPSTRHLRAYGLEQEKILSIIRADAPNAAHYLVIDACRNELSGARGGKGFVPVNQHAGTLIAFATAPGQTASDIGRASGPYAKALAAELVRPGVPDLLMFHNVRVAVTQATDGDQVPWTLDGIQRNQRIMFGGGKAPAQASAPRSASRLDAADREWRKLGNTTNRADLIAFAKRYPGTAFAELALLKAGQLGGGATGTNTARQAPKDDLSALMAALAEPQTGATTGAAPAAGGAGQVWRGDIGEPSGWKQQYTATVTLQGDGNATVEYPDFPCGGTLRATGPAMIFREHITWGQGCANGGTLRLVQQGDTLLYRWSRSPSSEIIATGTLSRVQ